MNYVKLGNFRFNSDLLDSILPLPGGPLDLWEDGNSSVPLELLRRLVMDHRKVPAGGAMDFIQMSREDLIKYINDMNDYMDNVIVFWGDKRELQATFRKVAENSDNEFTEKEVENASTILNSLGAFEEFIELLRDSFDRGGINYLISEKISAIMEEVAQKCRQN